MESINKDNFYSPDIDEMDKELRDLLKPRIGLIKSVAIEEGEITKKLIDFEDEMILLLIKELREWHYEFE